MHRILFSSLTLIPCLGFCLMPSCTGGSGTGSGVEPRGPNLAGHVEIAGTVRDESGVDLGDTTVTNANDVPVHLVTQGQVIQASTASVSGGTFAFYNLSPGTYRAQSSIVPEGERYTEFVTLAGANAEFTNSIELGPVSVGPAAALRRCFPNPFTISVSNQIFVATAGNVTLVVKDTSLNTVRTLRDEEMTTGGYVIEWDGTDEDQEAVSAGLYWIYLTVGGETSAELVMKQ